ncbi:hypothetical protein B7453_10380 [Pseudomonas sp. IB20]|uniref:hypothetical protein n=1 Tax=Pseudomonas sp. IB20 TaxID=1702250 RepID=UPI000B9FAE50|nr:hypothetical protein [Pseudomonas sp. IB20]OZO04535.1 hypothetical protein B7453_10380 [Pseudomonas sp. IB20]
MAKHLTRSDIMAIVDTLYAWQGLLTWDELCGAVTNLVGKRPTRQSLSANPDIKRAFDQAKAQSRSEVVHVPTPSSLKIAGERIARLESENEALKLQNSRLIERFLRWQYNASIKGLHLSQLDHPLPIIDRERSDATIRTKLKTVKKKP